MLNEVYRLIQHFQTIQADLQVSSRAVEGKQQAADLEIGLRQARKELFLLLESPSTLPLLFNPAALEFCHQLLEDYLNQNTHSKWITLLPKIHAQLDIVARLHALAGKVLEDLLRRYQQRELLLVGESVQRVRKQIKSRKAR